jgi:hypothetical protein
VVPPVSVPRTEVSIVPRDTTPAVRERSVQPVQAPPARPLRAPELAVRAPQLRDIPVQEREVSTVDAPVAPQPLRTADVQVRVPQRTCRCASAKCRPWSIRRCGWRPWPGVSRPCVRRRP